MQLFSCPFCGPRDETEFVFGAEAGRTRPEPAAEASAQGWADYLHFGDTPRGPAREIWLHLTCGEFFLMERDTVSHAVAASRPLRGGDA